MDDCMSQTSAAKYCRQHLYNLGFLKLPLNQQETDFTRYCRLMKDIVLLKLPRYCILQPFFVSKIILTMFLSNYNIKMNGVVAHVKREILELPSASIICKDEYLRN